MARSKPKKKLDCLIYAYERIRTEYTGPPRNIPSSWDSYDREFSLNIASAEQEVVYEIDEALKRINDGKYGKCVECNKKIPVRRLKALPHAKLCIQCQSKEEKDKR